MAALNTSQQSSDHAVPTPSSLGGRSFIDPAKLRILLTPIGDISEADFAKWCDYVRSFETIRLADLPSNCTARRRAAHAGNTSGNNTPSGSTSSSILQTAEVHLSFVTSYDPDHCFLAPFNMHRQVLGVLGLATFSNSAHNKHELETSPSALRERHPGALVHRVFGFDSGAKRPKTVDLSSIKDVIAAKVDAAPRPSSPSASSSLAAPADNDLASSVTDDTVGSASPRTGFSTPHPASSDAPGFAAHRAGGLIIFPAVRKDGKDVRFYLKTLLAELVANILDGLDHIVTSLEGSPLETPRETLDGITPNQHSSSSAATSSSTTGSWLSKTSAATSGLGAAASRASSLFTAFSSSSGGGISNGEGGTGTSTPNSSRPSSAVGGGSHPFDLASPSASTSSPTSKSSTRSKILAANVGKKNTRRMTSAPSTGPTGTGRYAKIKADLYLLSGNLWDALEGYSTALTALGKERALAGGQDAVWFASALEGFSVARVLVSRMGGVVLEKAPCFDLPWSAANAKEKEKDKDKDKEKDGIARPYAKQSWGEIAEAYTIAVVIYSKCLAPPNVLLEPVRSVANDTPRDYTHPLIHASACTQYARFLLAVWASGGWNGECFDQLVYGGVPPALAEEKPTNAMYLTYTAVSGIARHDIAAAASSALSHSIIALKPTDQITLLSTLTAIFGCIGFSRREAHLLRQLQSTIVGLLVKAKSVNARPPTTTSMPILQHQQFGKQNGELLGNIVAQTTYDWFGRGPEAVLVLALQICETYGIHVEVDPLKNVPPHHILSKATEGLRSAYASPALDEAEFSKPSESPAPITQAALLTPRQLAGEAPFGWKEQQISLLKEAIAVAELLADYIGMAFFSAILLRDFHAILDAEEQKDLMVGMQRSIQAARWAGAQDLAVKYWGPPEALCCLELLPLTPERMPYERDVKELFTNASAADAEKQSGAGLNNPFFWNPVSTSAGRTAKVMAVQGEPIQVMATLQNPFAVDLHIDSVKLVGEGAQFLAQEAVRISIPPYSFQTLPLSCIAKQVGTVSIKGITLTLAGGCTEDQTFLLPIYDDDSFKQRRKEAAENDDRKTRLKVTGLDTRSSVAKQKPLSTALAGSNGKGLGKKWLTVDVVAAQPRLAVYCPELEPIGGLDVFEGERHVIHLELVNLAKELDINYVKLFLSDDASEAAKQSLLEGNLLPQDVHEIEWDLVHQPALSQVDSLPRTVLKIEPGVSTTIPIHVKGKQGCTQAVVSIEYAHVDWERVQSGLKSKFHVRRIEVPFRVTVHPVVVCRNLRIAPLGAVEAARLTKECLTSSDAVPAALKRFEEDHLGGQMEVRPISAAGASDDEAGVKPVKIEPGTEVDDSEYCLLSVDVMNVHREDVFIRFALNTGGVLPLQLYRLLRAGSTTRIVLPQPRIELDPSTGRPFTPFPKVISEGNVRDGGFFPPIPSIWKEGDARQFIVSKVQLEREEEREVRKTFWYRESLFSRLSGGWLMLPSQTQSFALLDTLAVGEDVVRSGKILLRGISSGGGLTLDKSSLTRLQKDPVKLSLILNAGSRVIAETFTVVSASITNRLSRRIKPLIRLVPTTFSSAEQDAGLIENVVVSDGTFAATKVVEGLTRGEKMAVEWRVTFLSPGTFGFLVVVEEPTAELAEGGERLSFVSALHKVHVLPAV